MFTFVDLFAGIGGFRLPLQELGGNCVGFSEIDKFAIQTYYENFGCEETSFGDIKRLPYYMLGKIDVITGGVPCQPWSNAGKKRGFDDDRGQLWYDVIKTVKINKPKVFIFENVKGLADPRNKENLQQIITLLEDIGYIIPQPECLNTLHFGLPQNRIRLFIVGFRKDQERYANAFSYPKGQPNTEPLGKFLQDTVEEKYHYNGKPLYAKLKDNITLSDTRKGSSTIHSWDIIETTEREKEICVTLLQNRRKKKYGKNDGGPLSYAILQKLIPNLEESELRILIDKDILRFTNQGYDFVNSKNSAGINGIYRIYSSKAPSIATITATKSNDAVMTGDIIRKITPRECARLQGFPDSFVIPVSDTQAYKQFGNAVSVPVVRSLMQSILNTGIFTH